MGDNRIKFEEKQAVEPIVQHPKANEFMTVVLCLFVIVCYGTYLLLELSSVVGFAFKFNRTINEIQVLESLYLFGKLGLITHAIVESGILLIYVRSETIRLNQLIYLLTLVIISNLLIYAIVTHLYEYAITIIQ